MGSGTQTCFRPQTKTSCQETYHEKVGQSNGKRQKTEECVGDKTVCWYLFVSLGRALDRSEAKTGKLGSWRNAPAIGQGCGTQFGIGRVRIHLGRGWIFSDRSRQHADLKDKSSSWPRFPGRLTLSAGLAAGSAVTAGRESKDRAASVLASELTSSENLLLFSLMLPFLSLSLLNRGLKISVLGPPRNDAVTSRRTSR